MINFNMEATQWHDLVGVEENDLLHITDMCHRAMYLMESGQLSSDSTLPVALKETLDSIETRGLVQPKAEHLLLITRLCTDLFSRAREYEKGGNEEADTLYKSMYISGAFVALRDHSFEDFSTSEESFDFYNTLNSGVVQSSFNPFIPVENDDQSQHFDGYLGIDSQRVKEISTKILDQCSTEMLIRGTSKGEYGEKDIYITSLKNAENVNEMILCSFLAGQLVYRMGKDPVDTTFDLLMHFDKSRGVIKDDDETSNFDEVIKQIKERFGYKSEEQHSEGSTLLKEMMEDED